MTTPTPSPRLLFFHAHVDECDPVCVLESFGRDWQIEWAEAAPAGGLRPTKAALEAVKRLAAMRVDDPWVSKYYGTLEALSEAIGRPLVAEPQPPHVVMARLIEDVAWRLAPASPSAVPLDGPPSVIKPMDLTDEEGDAFVAAVASPSAAPPPLGQTKVERAFAVGYRRGREDDQGRTDDDIDAMARVYAIAAAYAEEGA